jgi:tetratricopeptide (TPR) repeat protein
MSSALVQASVNPALVAPWRDPYTVPAADLCAYIASLERACADHPASADLHTALGIAHAVNHDVYQSIDALDAAVRLDEQNFWAHLKYGELQYRLRILAEAETLTARALELASSPWQLALARRQLLHIRTARRASVRNLSWQMPIATPLAGLAATVVAIASWCLWR